MTFLSHDGSDRALRFGMVFEDSRDAMLVLDPSRDRIVDANDAASHVLGFHRTELRAMAVTALHPEQRPALVVFTQAVIAKGRWWTHSLTPRHAAGKALRLEYAASLLSGDPPLVLVTLAIGTSAGGV